MLATILNFIHFVILFLPVWIFIPPVGKILNPWMKYISLAFQLIPLHWVFFENRCLFTMLTGKVDADIQNAETTSAFSETYLKWLYQPVMSIIGWEWNSEGLDKMVTLHWICNLIVIWFYMF